MATAEPNAFKLRTNRFVLNDWRNLTPIREVMNWQDTVRATRIGVAHGRRPADQDTSRHPCLRQRHQPGGARKTSGGRRLSIGWFGYRAARFTTYRHKRRNEIFGRTRHHFSYVHGGS